MKLGELPLCERPREKAYRFGIETLSNTELLALIIGSGYKDQSALDIASELLKRGKSISGILNMDYRELTDVTGIKEACAFRFLAFSELRKREALLSEDFSFRGSKDIAIRYCRIIGGKKQENVYIVCINTKNEIIAEKLLYRGSKEFSGVSIQEIINVLSQYKCKSFVLIHNHPSGVTSPSSFDRITTNRLNAESAREHYILIDHIIVSENKYYSFMENQLI